MSSEPVNKPKKTRKRPSISTIEEAVNEIMFQNQSINKTALAFNISRAYLAKIVKKFKTSDEQTYKHCPDIGNKRIFTLDQENKLADYLKIASKMCYGLTRNQTKKLAYDYAVANKVCPETWIDRKIASDDWLRGFMHRNKDLAIRKPESTSLSRATSFNKTNVGDFFDKLSYVYEKYEFPPHMVFNTDETGCSTVTNPPKIIGERGSKQVGQVTSAERGTLVTTLFFINAAGGFLPPVFIFPRVHYKDVMLSNGPAGALGLANLSGWMNEECFLKALEHFVLHVRPSIDNPALILMDNHSSHVNLSVVEFARKNSIIIVTFPPHCSHKLQPLDVSVYGPFKTRYRVAMNEWMLSNPGKTITIYQVGQFVKEAYLYALSPNNVTQGFRKTGIYPLNSNTFSDEDFLSSFVTDRPEPSNDIDANSTPSALNISLPSTSGLQKSVTPINEYVSLPTSSDQQMTPEQVRPFLKAAPRLQKQKNRKMSSAVITDTPEKDKIEEKEASNKKKLVKNMTTKKTVKCLKPKAAKKDNSGNSDLNVSLHDDSSDSDNQVLSESERLKKKTRAAKSTSVPKSNASSEICVVCKGLYSKSKEEWYQCKLCGLWGHESCGIKGALNYFCKKCF